MDLFVIGAASELRFLYQFLGFGFHKRCDRKTESILFGKARSRDIVSTDFKKSFDRMAHKCGSAGRRVQTAFLKEIHHRDVNKLFEGRANQ
jgi:hypothetical protein